MRTLTVFLACALCLCVAAGCSEDSSPSGPIEHEVQLAQVNLNMGAGTSRPTNDTLRVCFVSSSSDTLFDLRITEADSGTVRTVTAFFYPPFEGAADRLSDGVDDLWMFWIAFLPNTSGGGAGNNESSWAGGANLPGAEITKARLYLDTIRISHEEAFTRVDLTGRIVIIGRPGAGTEASGGSRLPRLYGAKQPGS